MKRFILKSILFILPFSILFIVTTFLYSETEGDLLRLGYIPHLYKNYRNNFPKVKEVKFVKVSVAKKKKYKIMTIGDSFSEGGAEGYKNYLAEDFSVLHIDRFISKNQIQTLIELLNGDFFANYEIQYVVLQGVERHLIENITNIEIDKKLDKNQLDSLVKAEKKAEKKTTSDYKYEFFSKTTIQFPFYYLPKYFLSDNYISNDLVYNYDLNNNNFFSNHSNKLLFYHLDIKNAQQNNDINNCIKLNDVLNYVSRKLKEKNITLIFLPSPDKYDLYYDFIANKTGLTKPLFFDNFKSLKKEYAYIDSKSILYEHIHTKQDLFFYDDTHWSSIATKIIADKIKETINYED